MRFIKLAIISFVLLFLLLTGISLLLPSHIVVRRAIEVDASKEEVRNELSDLSRWHNWLLNRDTLPLTVSKANNKQLLTMGNTTVNISSVTIDAIKTHWRVNNGKVLPGTFTFIEHENNTTTIQWDFEQNIGWYPWDKFGSVASDKVLGPFMEQSLKNLKDHLETLN